jgi:hypothetical protein
MEFMQLRDLQKPGFHILPPMIVDLAIWTSRALDFYPYITGVTVETRRLPCFQLGLFSSDRITLDDNECANLLSSPSRSHDELKFRLIRD